MSISSPLVAVLVVVSVPCPFGPVLGWAAAVAEVRGLRELWCPAPWVQCSVRVLVVVAFVVTVLLRLAVDTGNELAAVWVLERVRLLVAGTVRAVGWLGELVVLLPWAGRLVGALRHRDGEGSPTGEGS